MLKPPPPRLRPCFCLRTSCLLPVGGVGNTQATPSFCVLDAEGWRERAVRDVGQISVLSWKLRIQSVHAHPHPRIRPLQPTGVCRAQKAP